MNTGEQIRNCRKKAGLSQKELAKKLGVSQQYIAQYENGKRTPKIGTLYKILEALDCDFFDFTEELGELKSEIEKASDVLDFDSAMALTDTLLEKSRNDNDIIALEAAAKTAQIAKDKYKDKYPPEIRLILAYDELNDNGKEEAVKRVEELTEIPRYTKSDEPPQEQHPNPTTAKGD